MKIYKNMQKYKPQCNPVSGARDVAALVGSGYTLRAARPIDLFPHTPHVEVVFTLERAEAIG